MIHLVTDLHDLISVETLLAKNADKDGLNGYAWREARGHIWNLDVVTELNKYLGRLKVVLLSDDDDDDDDKDLVGASGLLVARSEALDTSAKDFNLVKAVQEYVSADNFPEGDSVVIAVDPAHYRIDKTALKSLKGVTVIEIDPETGIVPKQIQEIADLV